MEHTDSIDHGIAAHARWKFRLIEAIRTNTDVWNVAKAQWDDHCEFCNWLLSIPLTARLSDHWRKVKALHREVHKSADEILRLARAGRKDEAEAAIAPRSHFASVSCDLTMAMSAWKEAIAGS
jgi:hypothetical protein